MDVMLIVFEVHLVPGADAADLLSAETIQSTHAQIMTVEEAKKVGFAGLPEPPPGKEVRLVAVAKRDAGWIHRALETSEAVGGFHVHEVG
jgi:alanyl-tRNA synthetase